MKKQDELVSSFIHFIQTTKDNSEIPEITQSFHDSNLSGTESLIKVAGKHKWLGGSVFWNITNELLKLNFSILTPESGRFITSDFPIAYETYDDTETGRTYPKWFYLPIHPRYALLYSKSSKNLRNKLLPISQEMADFYNRLYLQEDPDSEMIQFLIFSFLTIRVI